MRLRLLVLFASAVLALVPAFAFADDDNAGDTDREPVALTTPVAAAQTPPTASTDANDDHADHGERGQHTDPVTDRAEARADQVTDRAEARADQVTDRAEARADQVTDRSAWCQTHADACTAAVTAYTDKIVAWCKAHADKCSADQLKKVLDRLAQCAAQPKACALAAEAKAVAADAREDARDDDKHEDRPASTPPVGSTTQVEHPLVTTPRVPTTTHHSAPSSEVHTGEGETGGQRP